ncbi:MAG TPA: biotin/lipoyl-binding protein, partial [Hyphomicrobium zavarzinii]|nr:biotin/lipoyl-binding protein [Hyphomicrobium zavarzinii]
MSTAKAIRFKDPKLEPVETPLPGARLAGPSAQPPQPPKGMAQHDAVSPVEARADREVSPAESDAPKGGAGAAQGEAPRSRKKLLLGGIAAVVLGAGLWFGYDYITVGRFMVSTDDAYVGADMALISPKVAANVAEVPVVENQSVKEGDVLVRLDDGDFQ